MARRLLAAIAAAVLLAGTWAGSTPAAAGTRPVQAGTYPHPVKVKLLGTNDFRLACLTMDRDGRYTVEDVDYVIRVKLFKGDRWHNVWVARDGWQFTVDTAGRQNPPWSCTPLPLRVPVPDSWAEEAGR